jgi:hypothetical protein
MSLNSPAVRLGELGRREECLIAIEEAVTVYRRLANQVAYLAPSGHLVEQPLDPAG